MNSSNLGHYECYVVLLTLAFGMYIQIVKSVDKHTFEYILVYIQYHFLNILRLRLFDWFPRIYTNRPLPALVIIF